MIELVSKQDCCGCGACVRICPKNCIDMVEDKEGFLYPVTNLDLCVDCGLCNKVCPIINASEEKREPLASYAAKANQDEVVKTSSSGGVFQLLAKETLAKGGVAFGAKFNKVWDVEHAEARNLQELSGLLGSKYVQSDKKETFKQVEAALKNGEHVLFSGTPCEIAGLKNFLRKDYEQLLCVAVFCHGVPSPKVWRLYLSELLADNGLTARENISFVTFRDKTRPTAHGHSQCLTILDSNNKALYSASMWKNPYGLAFGENVILRPSCYACRFRGYGFGADLYLGDYWGIEKHHPDIENKFGMSAVIVCSEKGRQALSSLSLDLQATKLEAIEQGNLPLTRNYAEPKARKAFFRKLGEKPVISSLEKSVRPRRSLVSYLYSAIDKAGLLPLAQKIKSLLLRK